MSIDMVTTRNLKIIGMNVEVGRQYVTIRKILDDI